MKNLRFIIFLLLIANMQLFSMSDLEENKYNVGFSYYQEYDTTRLYTCNEDTIFRPMLIHFWYPTIDESNECMNFKHYVDLISIREDYSKTRDAIDSDTYNFVDAYAQFAKNSYKIGLDIGTQQILESPVNACLDLPIAKGEFPLIIYAPSNSKSPIQNHLICEYLASKGFYVISVPSAGPNSIERRDSKLSIIAQVEDMEFILDYVVKKLEINYSSVGVFGFSTGGLAASTFQMKHDFVQANLSMDGSQEYSFYLSLSTLDAFDVNKTKVPYLLLGNYNSQSIYPYFNSVKSENKFFFRMSHLSHFGFVSFWTFFDLCNPDSIKHNFTSSYEFICERAFTFFDATLNENKASKAEILSADVQNSDCAVNENIDYSQALILLNTYLGKDIDSAISTYKKHKSLKLYEYNYSEEEISALGRMIIDQNTDASRKLFAYNLEEYPGSWHAYFDLAFLYKLTGEFDLAKTTLLKALQIEPGKPELKDLLKELEEEL